VNRQRLATGSFRQQNDFFNGRKFHSKLITVATGDLCINPHRDLMVGISRTQIAYQTGVKAFSAK